jgi:formylglycine-generating enzyme
MTTFISYSRHNSDFALRLARDLKAAGSDVWFDQLDIPTGARWDDEIEKGLDKSKIFLIILSPESIESQNVKDEIGYAIDAGKQILPVVLKNCNVPFRLRRFQYVDFTNKPYEDSLAEIKQLLTSSEKLGIVRGDKEDEGPVEIPAEPAVPEKIIDENKSAPQEKPRGKLAPWVIIAGVVIICVAVIAIGIGLVLNSPSTTTTIPAGPASSFAGAGIPTQANVNNPAAPTEILTPANTSISSSTFPVNQTEIVDSKGVSMRLVPSGSFSMGYGNGDPATGETAVHTVNVSAFYMDKYLVTNASYKQCVDGGSCQPPVDSSSATRTSYYGNSEFAAYPVINVNWDMANVYCTWRGARLPSEAEWEKAARGIDGRIWPWGTAAPDSTRADFNGTDTTKVSGFESGKSPSGIYDMAGNVWEWVADWYQAKYYATLGNTASDPLGPDSPDKGTGRVIRGGGWWKSSGGSIRSTLRNSSDPSKAYKFVGFRCARSTP